MNACLYSTNWHPFHPTVQQWPIDKICNICKIQNKFSDIHVLCWTNLDISRHPNILWVFCLGWSAQTFQKTDHWLTWLFTAHTEYGSTSRSNNTSLYTTVSRQQLYIYIYINRKQTSSKVLKALSMTIFSSETKILYLTFFQTFFFNSFSSFFLLSLLSLYTSSLLFLSSSVSRLNSCAYSWVCFPLQITSFSV